MSTKQCSQLTLGIVFLSLMFISIWAIDISVTALMNGLILTNGIINANPTLIYHLALLILVVCAVSFMLLLVHTTMEK